MDLYMIRLSVVREQVENHLKECKDLLVELQEGKVQFQEVSSAAALLKVKTNRYVSETHIFIEKYPLENAAAIIMEHTKIQMESDDVITKIDQMRSIIQNENISYGIDNVTSRLPKLELVKFHGDVLRWHEFWDRFSSSVHNKNIRAVDKLTYLHACLQGIAKEAIQGLETTDLNYEIALNVLRERFGKRTVVIDAHYYELIYKLKAEDSTIKESRRIINEIERHLRVLQSLGEDIDGGHLRVVIIDKFPSDIIQELRMRMESKENTVATIRKHLEHIISARESSSSSSEQVRPIYSTDILHVQGREKFMKRRFEQKGSDYYKKPRMSCIFCEGSHYNDECVRVPSITERKQKLNNRCFSCFRLNHSTKDCNVKRKCVYCGKYGLHNRALCPEKVVNIPKSSTEMVKSFQNNVNNYPVTVLQTAIIQVKDNENKIHECRLLLDCGSERLYITKQLAKELDLEIIDSDRLLVYTFGQNEPRKLDSPKVIVKINTSAGCSKVIHANIVPFISENVSHFPFRPELPNIKLADDGSRGGHIDLLIGNDYYFSTIKGGKLAVHKNLFLIETEFGWVWSGKTENNKNEHILSAVTYFETGLPNNLGLTSPDPPLKDCDVTQLWELESIGIKDCPKSINEEEALKNFNDTVTYKDQRYYVKWPWIQYPPSLPSNYGLAWGRLRSLLSRNQTATLSAYNEIIQEQLLSGVIEKVDNYLQLQQHPVHYLPHHLVVRKDDSSKLRIVYDASARTNPLHLSLNECLFKGPLMLEDLTGLLIKFRQHKVGLTADVEKAFLQVGLQAIDRDVTRFLWVKDINKELSQDSVECYRFCRVPFGVISSPFLLNATIKYHLSSYNNDTLKNVAQNIYVDNLVSGVESKPEAIQLFKGIYEALQEISMNTRQWNSNDKEFIKLVPENLRENKETTKVLGLIWNTTDDTLQIKLSDHLTEYEKTSKRSVLKDLASIYDPCGFLAPAVLPAKLFLQELWKMKINWDTKLANELSDKWQEIIRNIMTNKKRKIQRYVGTEETAEEYELHCFTDSSKKAYAAVIYMRCKSKNEVKVSFVMSKSRVAPLKHQEDLQIPKLELLGCLIGSRLLEYTKNNSEVPISKLCMWTDSQIVINWLRSDKLLPPFVARRVTEIKSKPNVQILYVSSENNPADIATRDEKFNRNEMWFHGPQFLRETFINYNDKWTITQNVCVAEGLTNQSELKDTRDNTQENLNKEQIVTQEMNEISDVSDIAEHQDNQTSNTSKEDQIKENIKKEQKSHYPVEYAGKVTDTSRSLGVFKDDENILRCKSRTSLADISYDQKYPILLPRKSNLTLDIIKKLHRANYHVGVSHTLSLVRQKYWIPQGRAAVQKVLNKCMECKKHGGGPYKLPQMPQLPKERVNYEKAFTFIGLDYLGPLLVSNKNTQAEKRWICLYTCLAVRALHLELVKDLTAEECTMALRRFIACRGMPSLIISDNAAQFKLTAEVMTGPYCVQNKVLWKFIPELAPWHGGFYERLVALVKQCLKKTVDKHMLCDNQLSTIIKEIEVLLNTRPLTYVGAEIDHVLIPQDFLCLNKCLMKPSDIPYESRGDTETKQYLIEAWKRGQRVLEEFSKMFTNHYLMSIRERKQTTHKQPRITSKRVPKIGEMVQIKGDTNNRSLWRVGKIVSVLQDKDKEVRVATVKVGDKEFVRSIAHLYPLEIEDQNFEYSSADKADETPEPAKEVINVESQIEESIVEEISEPIEEVIHADLHIEDNIVEGSRSSSRAAAKKARERITNWTRELVSLIVNVSE